jgi:hypothetical protein
VFSTVRQIQLNFGKHPATDKNAQKSGSGNVKTRLMNMTKIAVTISRMWDTIEKQGGNPTEQLRESYNADAFSSLLLHPSHAVGHGSFLMSRCEGSIEHWIVS